MFEILAKAKAGALYRLLAKLPVDEAAIVLTNLPNPLAIQVIAYYPAEMQAEIGPAMVDARWAEPEKIEHTKSTIQGMLAQAKQNLAAKNGAAPAQTPASAKAPAPAAPLNAPPPSPPVSQEEHRRLMERSRPGTPVARPASNQFGKGGNPYQTAPDSHAGQPKPQEAPPAINADTGKPTLAARAKELAKTMLRPPAKRKGEPTPPPQPPQKWTPRQATASPINGPALPGTPPPVAGDPFASPLAKAGLLDVIGRAQEKFLPKDGTAGKAGKGGAARPPAQQPALPLRPRPRLDKNGRPEPVEGMLAPGDVRFVKTPRVIGPGAPKRAAGGGGDAVGGAAGKGARRMDGKAILAAILRESDAKTRNAVKRDDPALFKQLKGRMFYFDDLVLTDDNALARVFTAAPTEDSALALKFAAPALKEKVFRAVSPGRARALREHGEVRAGLDEVEKAQQTVLDVALQLQSAGRILIDPRDPDLAGQ